MIWTETPLSKFGFKCVMSKHDYCFDSSCECLCHEAAFELFQDNQKSPLLVTKNVIWFKK